VIVVDEAQELAAPRLRIVSALTAECSVIVAADEFQCLDEGLDTGPFMTWFQTGDITQLDHNHRTNVAGLLAAGASLRQLSAPANGAGIRIAYKFKNLAPFEVGAAITNAQGSVAVLFPPAGAEWAKGMKERLAQGLKSRFYNIGPIHLNLEAKASDEVDAVVSIFAGQNELSREAVAARLAGLDLPPRWLPQVHNALRLSAERQGKVIWTAADLKVLCEKKAANHRAYSPERARGVPLISIHQAKNRQFDHVIILWPPGVPGSNELKARLLYNGITRARRSCKIFVRVEGLLNEPPFAFPPI
jgi:hypothetical protein